MSDALYEDDQCEYEGGDPRFGDVGRGALTLTADSIVFEPEDKNAERLHWPRSAIREVRYVPYSGESSTPIIKLQDWPAVSIIVRDPEGVLEGGFIIRITFRSEYYARVFVRWACATFGLLLPKRPSAP